MRILLKILKHLFEDSNLMSECSSRRKKFINLQSRKRTSRLNKAANFLVNGRA